MIENSKVTFKNIHLFKFSNSINGIQLKINKGGLTIRDKFCLFLSKNYIKIKMYLILIRFRESRRN